MSTEMMRLRGNAIAFRNEDTTGAPVLFGHAARFNEWTEIDSAIEGHFMERIAPGAFAKTLAESADSVRCLFAHGFDPQIGDKVLGTFRTLTEDSEGLYYEVDLYDTSYNRDLEPGLRDGQYGASFRARLVAGKTVVNRSPGRSEHNPNGIEERTHTELMLRELGPCTFGAYPTASSAVRSITDRYLVTPRQLADVGADNPQSPEPVRHSESVNDNARLRLMLHQAGLTRKETV